jgi:hypothetical protein
VGPAYVLEKTAAVVSEKVATFAKATAVAESNAFTNGLGWSRQEKFHLPISISAIEKQTRW